MYVIVFSLVSASLSLVRDELSESLKPSSTMKAVKVENEQQ